MDESNVFGDVDRDAALEAGLVEVDQGGAVDVIVIIVSRVMCVILKKALLAIICDHVNIFHYYERFVILTLKFAHSPAPR